MGECLPQDGWKITDSPKLEHGASGDEHDAMKRCDQPKKTHDGNDVIRKVFTTDDAG